MGEMDYIYTMGQEKILIESVQKEVKLDIIQQYKDCRKNQRITQTELSERTGISQPNITRFESGKYNPSLEMMVKIASALGMKLQIELVKEEVVHNSK